MFTEDFDADLLAGMPSPYTGDIGEFVRQSQLVNQHFSAETRDALQRLRVGRIRYHQFVDIPVTEAIPPTQTDYTARIPKQTFQSEGVIGAVSLDLGNLFGYEETSSYVIYDIYPVKGLEDSRSFVNSRKMLSFHSDGSAHPTLSPDYVLLYCIRSDPAATNLIADLDVLLRELPSDVVNVLMQPVFKHLVSQRPERYQLKPILFLEGQELVVTYDEDNVFGCNDAAISAQNLLNDRLHNVAAEIGSTDNSLLVIDNKRCLHARTSFTPKFDGKDRWIKGAFVTRSEVPTGSILSLSLGGLPDTIT
jgi:L-asparagine oxygenase